MDKNQKTKNRIWFKGNPWENGHALKEARFYGILKEDGIYLHLEIKSENYYAAEGFQKIHEIAEKHDKLLEEQGNKDDWKFYGSWLNYHACHIQPNKNMLLGNKDNPFQLESLSNLALTADNPPPKEDTWDGLDFDNLMFHCYIMGHDAVGYHQIKVSPTNTAFRYDIDWEGKVALAYVGDEEFRYSFKVQLRDLPFEGFDGQSRLEYKYKNKEEQKDGFWYDTREARTLEERENELRNWLEQHTTINQSALQFKPEDKSDWLKFH